MSEQIPAGAGSQVQVVVTLHPSTWETPMTSHGHHFESFFPAHEALGGSVVMQWANGAVDRYQIHGQEREPGDDAQTLGIWDGDHTMIEIPVEVSGGTLHFSNLASLRNKDSGTYAGTLIKDR